LDAVDVADAGDFAEVLRELGEMAEIDGFDNEVDVDGTVYGGLGIERTDVGAVFGDDGGELFEQAGAVVADHREFDRVSGGLGGVGLVGRGSAAVGIAPLDFDAAVGLVEEVLYVGTTARVDGDSLAAGDVADDLFAADGVATARAIDEEIVLPFDLKGVRTFAEEDALDSVRHIGEGAGVGLGVGVFGGHRAAGFELVEHLARGVFAEADAGEEVLFVAKAVVVGDAVEVDGGEVGERDFVLAGFAVEELFADFDGAGALVFVEPVLDLVASAGGFGEAEPVAGRIVAGLGGDFDDVAVAELVAERNDASVYFCACGCVANVGVDGVGEVDGCAVFGRTMTLPLGVKV